MMRKELWFGRSRRRASGVSRRDVFKGGAIAAFGLPGISPARAATGKFEVGPNLYQSIGVRPIINCKGTFTIISGSLSLPEVKRAMDEAGSHYVHMDELMDGVGKRLAQLTGAEWGIVSAGCAAGMTNVTAACLAGTDPEKMQRLPNLAGLKSEVIAPAYSRNVYDHAIRMLGVKIVEVSSPEQLESAFNERTAMVYILAGPGDDGPLGTEAVSSVARRKGVPVFVDAAAEDLTIPNLHLKRGASVVAYSGGKCLRGPQCAGLLLGEKNLLQAAWANSAPHHAFGRSLKVGKEEIMGMLTAVEMWTRRDHQAEWNQWQSWLDYISVQVTKAPGVTTRTVQPDSLSNHAPSLVIAWNPDGLGITGREVAKHLYDTEPRIIVGDPEGRRASEGETAIGIMPYMMNPGDEKVAADRIYAVLSKPPQRETRFVGFGSPVSAAGRWDLEIQFLRGSARHTVMLEQSGSVLTGTHEGEFLSGDLAGTVEGDHLHFRTSHRIEGTSLSYTFDGKVDGDAFSGTVSLGEYGEAQFSGHRHAYGGHDA